MQTNSEIFILAQHNGKETMIRYVSCPCQPCVVSGTKDKTGRPKVYIYLHELLSSLRLLGHIHNFHVSFHHVLLITRFELLLNTQVSVLSFFLFY